MFEDAEAPRLQLVSVPTPESADGCLVLPFLPEETDDRLCKLFSDFDDLREALDVVTPSAVAYGLPAWLLAEVCLELVEACVRTERGQFTEAVS